MMSYRFKLAGVLLSAGLAMTACGGGEEGTDGSDGAPEENGQDTEQSSQENTGSDDAEDTRAEERMEYMEANNGDGGNDTSDGQSEVSFPPSPLLSSIFSIPSSAGVSSASSQKEGMEN